MTVYVGTFSKIRIKCGENGWIEMLFRPASSENKMVAWVQSTALTALPSTSRSSNGGLSSRPRLSFSLPPHSGCVLFPTHRYIEFVGQEVIVSIKADVHRGHVNLLTILDYMFYNTTIRYSRNLAFEIFLDILYYNPLKRNLSYL